MSNVGMFGMRTPQDLLRKAAHDLARFKSEPMNAYAAFDFFVSARHIPDWVHPDDSASRNALFAANVELRICRHIADTGKHFLVTQKHHGQVKATGKTHNRWGKSWGKSWGGSWGRDALLVHLDDKDPDTLKFGETIDALELAESLMMVLNKIVPTELSY